MFEDCSNQCGDFGIFHVARKDANATPGSRSSLSQLLEDSLAVHQTFAANGATKVRHFVRSRSVPSIQ
jgi:hypothetical protein